MRTDLRVPYAEKDEAKRLGARRVIALVNRGSYVDLLQGNRIDVVVSPNLSTIGSILAYIRRGDVEAVHPLRRGAAEAMEAIAAKARAEGPEAFHDLPATTPVSRPDETAAARNPVLRWQFEE